MTPLMIKIKARVILGEFEQHLFGIVGARVTKRANHFFKHVRIALGVGDCLHDLRDFRHRSGERQEPQPVPELIGSLWCRIHVFFFAASKVFRNSLRDELNGDALAGENQGQEQTCTHLPW